MRSASAGLAYFAGMFALGFVLGAARVLLLAPVLGVWGANFSELPVMLAISWTYFAWLLRRFAVPATPGVRIIMGTVALTLLMIAEVVLGLGPFDRSFSQQVGEMTSGPGLAGQLGQVAFALFPLVQLGRGLRGTRPALTGPAAVGIAFDASNSVRRPAASLMDESD